MQKSGPRDDLTLVHTLGSLLTPDPSLSLPAKPLPGDSLLRGSSNAWWWKHDEMAFVGPDGSLQIVHVPSGQRLMHVDHLYFLPGLLHSLLPAI